MTPCRGIGRLKDSQLRHDVLPLQAEGLAPMSQPLTAPTEACWREEADTSPPFSSSAMVSAANRKEGKLKGCLFGACGGRSERASERSGKESVL